MNDYGMPYYEQPLLPSSVIGYLHRQDRRPARPVRRANALELFAGSFPDCVKEYVPSRGEGYHFAIGSSHGTGGVLGVHEVFRGVSLHLTGVFVKVVAHRSVPERPEFQDKDTWQTPGGNRRHQEMEAQ